nr:retrovirus-related Pol polyprotein from transposon TNT 1-94 [Tanacetum cinerariifolium]
MVAILEKTEHNTDFHQIVDFLEASHIRYALTISPVVYVSHIRQFWSTARIETTNQETKILTTVDGKPRTIFESSLRRHLKLNDEEGISYLPDAELFENLSLMGYNILPNQINKVRLVAQGYTQEEGIDYEEVFAPITRIKAIRLFLAYALFMGFIVYQMDVKSAILYGTIDEEVYVMQPPRF